MFLWLSGRALRQQCKRLWVQFPGNTYWQKCTAWIHCKSLWIKASAKCINVSVITQFGVAWRWSVCGTAEVVWKPRFLWQWPSAHLHLFGLFISSWQYPIYSLWGSGLVSLLASQAHQHHGHLTNFWCFWQCGQVPNPAGKWNQHL